MWKNDPNDLIISISTTPAKGDLVYIDGTMYRVSDLRWNFSTNLKKEYEILILLNQINWNDRFSRNLVFLK